ncbi:MAG: sugar phosphate isomerase/epimerase family protein [Bacteroidota bacterium]
MDKRTFLRQSVILAAGAPLFSLSCASSQNQSDQENTRTTDAPDNPLPYLDQIGLQVWTVRDQMNENARLTLQTLAEIGYQQVELYDLKNLEAHQTICDDLGLSVNSMHIGSVTVTGRWELTPNDTPIEFEALLDRAKSAGISHLVVPYLHKAERENLDGYKLTCDHFNRAGEQAKDVGISLCYHNHNFEFAPMEGSDGFQTMVARLEPDLVSFELDVFWAKIAGKDPMAVMENLGPRLSLLHLKDLKANTSTTTTLDGIPDRAFEEIGDGIIDMKAIMRLGAQLGVNHCFVEQDRSPAPMESTRRSYEFLNA